MTTIPTTVYQTLADIVEVLRGLRQSALLAAAEAAARDPYEQRCAEATAQALAGAIGDIDDVLVDLDHAK